MPDEISKFITASDNANDYSDDLLDKLEQARLEEIDNLMNDAENRDDELWEDMGVAPELIVEDYEEIEEEDRDLEWIIGLAGLSVASQTQFFLDNREDTVIKPLAYREQVMEPFELTASQLKTAGIRGVDFISDVEFVKLQTKYLDELSFLRNMSNTELYNTLLDAGALRPLDQHVADSMQYVSRMTSYKPGSTQFKAAVNDLIAADSKRAMKVMNRRSVERIYVQRQADGDPTKRFAWIVEGGPKTCSECVFRAGQIMTLEEWQSAGMPGEEVCLGGGYCRCHLAVVIEA